MFIRNPSLGSGRSSDNRVRFVRDRRRLPTYPYLVPIEEYVPPFALMIVGLLIGEAFGDASAIGAIVGGLFVWSFFWTIRIWCEHGEAVRLLRERDRIERMARMLEELDRDRRA